MPQTSLLSGGQEAARTALVLDIDGVVCPSSGSSPFGELVEVGMALRPVLVAPQLCAALTRLAALPGVTPAWLTSWLPETRRAMRRPFPGRDWSQLDLAGAPGMRDGWAKWPALRAWLADNPQVTRLAWVDDDLVHPASPHMGDGPPVDRVHAYTEQLRRKGIDALLLAPVPDRGLTPEHLTRLTHWIGTGQGLR